MRNYFFTIFLLLLIACKTSKFLYDPSKDGGKVFPKGTRILSDTLGVRLYELTILPGDSVPLHNHPDHIFYVIQGGKVALYMNGGERMEGEMMNGEGFVHGPVIDKAINIGNTTIKAIVADIYRPR
jgi:hypothetical protein